MRFPLAALAPLLLWVAYAALAAQFSYAASAAHFSFAALGDAPYSAAEEPQFIAMLGEINREPLAFAVHVGDFKSAQSECSDALFLQRRDWFGLSHHAFVFVPGDNEWVDCRRAYWARRDPLERLEKLRELFFARDTTLGQSPIPAARQAKRGYPEHLRWTVQNVVFATLNVPGPNNNAAMPKESRPRTAAVLQWMREAFAIAAANGSPAVVLMLQANLWTGASAYAEILAALAEEAQAFGREVLVVHGDTHWFRFDQPLVDPRSGRKIANVTRLEVYGSPFVNWVHVSVRVKDGRARFSAVPGSDLNREKR